MTDQLRVGFVGLGSQGGPMARRIAGAGFATTLWARRPEVLATFADSGARTAPSLRDLGAASDVLCVCVVADRDVDAVLRGPDGALAGMTAGATVVIHSTVHPETCHRLRDDHPDIRFLDAPVSGGGHRAAAGELLVMVGGDRDVFERCRPVLETFARPLLHLGSLGSGQRAKVLNNAVFTAQIGLAADAFTIAASHDLDRAALTEVLRAGSGRSYAAEVVAAAGDHLEAFAANAGPLLAKDVAILRDLAAPRHGLLIDTAGAALGRLGVAVQQGGRS